MGQNAHRGPTATAPPAPWPAQGGSRRPRVRGAVGAVVALAAASLLSGCGTTLTHAATTLQGARDVQVVHADGNLVAGVNGLRLRPGDVVRTGAAGRAELHTRGRVV